MLGRDVVRFALGALRAHRLRASLTALGIGIGVASVVLLTSIGEGVQRFVVSEFTQFGTNLVAVVPGRVTTTGLPGAILGTVRPLTVEDAAALARIPQVLATVPLVSGNAAAEWSGRSRRTNVIGTGPVMPRAYGFRVAEGRFLPHDDPRTPRALAVIGATLRRELFGPYSPLGQRIRVGGERYLVVGVLEPKGQFLNIDLDDAVYLPATRALALFNREGLMEIDLSYAPAAPVEGIVGAAKRLLVARHGAEDVTLITQQQMLDVLGSILSVLTFAVGALGGISLVVGGVGILTIMTIAVTERTAEIGLLRALGLPRGQLLALFLGEAVVLAALGGAGGLALGAGGAWLLGQLVPALPVHTSWFFAAVAETVAGLVGLSAGVLPARRAATVDPVEALRAE